MANPQIINIEYFVMQPNIKKLAELYFRNKDEYREAVKWIDGKTNIDAKIKKKCIKKLQVGDLFTVRIRITLDNCYAAVASALRRMVVYEQDHYALEVDYDDVATNDENVDRMELIQNINIMPIRCLLTSEEVENVTMSLYIESPREEDIMVCMGDLSIHNYHDNKPLFIPTTELIQLNANKFLEINNISIVKGDTSIHSKFLVGKLDCSWELDRIKGVTTAMSKTTKQEVTFNLDLVYPKDIENTIKTVIRKGLIQLIVNLNNIIDVVKDSDPIYVTTYQDNIVITMPGTHSITSLLDTIFDHFFPHNDYIGTSVLNTTRNMTIHVKGKDGKEKLLNTLSKCVELYTDVLAQLDSYIMKKIHELIP